MHHIPNDHYSLCLQTTEDSKQEKQDKKNDQPPQAKKPKVKTKTVELPVEGKLHWQLSTDVLNMFVENEVMLLDSAGMSACCQDNDNIKISWYDNSSVTSPWYNIAMLS